MDIVFSGCEGEDYQFLLCICRSATRWWRENIPKHVVLNTIEWKAVVFFLSFFARNIWLVWYMFLYWWCGISFTSFTTGSRWEWVGVRGANRTSACCGAGICYTIRNSTLVYFKALIVFANRLIHSKICVPVLQCTIALAGCKKSPSALFVGQLFVLLRCMSWYSP